MAETPKRVSVGCGCGWRGKRVPHGCACYDEYAMYCRCRWGSCPKCDGRVFTMESQRMYAKLAAEPPHA
jgi:hypothetical protein